jgi:hypothetical protein
MRCVPACQHPHTHTLTHEQMHAPTPTQTPTPTPNKQSHHHHQQHPTINATQTQTQTYLAEPLELVHVLVPAIIPRPGPPLRVLVGHHRPQRLQHGPRDEVLAGDQLDALHLPRPLVLDDPPHLLVLRPQRTRALAARRRCRSRCRSRCRRRPPATATASAGPAASRRGAPDAVATAADAGVKGLARRSKGGGQR